MSLIQYQEVKENVENPIEVANRSYVPNMKILTNKFSPENDNFAYQAVWICRICYKFLPPSDVFCRKCDEFIGHNPELENSWVEKTPKIVACLCCGFFLKLKYKTQFKNSAYTADVKNEKCGVFRTYMKDGVVRKKKNEKYDKYEYDYVELERDIKGLPLALSKNIGIKNRLSKPHLTQMKRPSRSTSVESHPKRPKVQHTPKSPAPQRRFKLDTDFIQNMTNKENDMSALLNEDNFSQPPDIPNLSFNTSEIIDLAIDSPDSSVEVTVKQNEPEPIDLCQFDHIQNDIQQKVVLPPVVDTHISIKTKDRPATKSARVCIEDESDDDDAFQTVEIPMPQTIASDIKPEPEVLESPLVKLKKLLASQPSKNVFSAVISNDILENLKSDQELSKSLDYLGRYFQINMKTVGYLFNSLLVYANSHQSEVPSFISFYIEMNRESRFWYDSFLKCIEKYHGCASTDICSFENQSNCLACTDIFKARDINRLQLAVTDKLASFLEYSDSVNKMLNTYHQ